MADEELQGEEQEPEEQEQAEEQSAETESGDAKYVGQGDYIAGVPARDLSAEEWDALDEGLRERARNLGLYEVID